MPAPPQTLRAEVKGVIRECTVRLAAQVRGLAASTCRNAAGVALVVLGFAASVGRAGTRCESGWRRVQAGGFSFCAPAELRGGPGQGIDSAVGRYWMPGMTINYDYGMYTGCTVRRDEKVRIDGARDASMSVERRSGPESDSLAFTVELLDCPHSSAHRS